MTLLFVNAPTRGIRFIEQETFSRGNASSPVPPIGAQAGTRVTTGEEEGRGALAREGQDHDRWR